MEDKKQGYKVKEYHGPVKRYCQTLNLKDNPELIAEYRKRHSQGEVWPETLAAIREVGSRLKCTHINDNHGGPADEHLFPYNGTLDWTKTVRALKEIGYEGDFAYELVPSKAGADHQPEWLRYTVDMGRYLMGL